MLYVVYASGDQVQNSDMDRAYDADRGEERCIQGFDGRMILK